MRNSIRFSIFAIGFSLAAMTSPGFADDMSASQAATYKEIEGMFGKVPEFVKKFPKAGIAGAMRAAVSNPPKTKTFERFIKFSFSFFPFLLAEPGYYY